MSVPTYVHHGADLANMAKNNDQKQMGVSSKCENDLSKTKA